MTLPHDRRGRTPRDRFRNILSADKDDNPAPETRKPTVVNLPSVRAGSEGHSPGTESGEQASQPLPGAHPGARILPTFWTAGGILSIVANLVLSIMLISSGRGLGALNPTASTGEALLGLYTSLGQMDRARIRATIPVRTTIALDTSVPVKSSTNITLARDVVVQGAHVTINTALFNIDAPAAVTLPAGTSMDVALDMALPMKTTVPISADVPVDIAVSDTDLHGAIQGLQDALRPLLCAASPSTILPDGMPACR